MTGCTGTAPGLIVIPVPGPSGTIPITPITLLGITVIPDMCPSIMAGIIMGGITMAEQAAICMATIYPSRSLTPVVPVHWAELPVPWDAA